MEAAAAVAPQGASRLKGSRTATIWLRVVTGVLFFTALEALTGFAGEAGAAFIGKWFWNIVLLGSAGAILARAWVNREERTAWALLGISLLFWTIGNLYYSFVLWDLESIPIPSFSDVAWLAMYPGTYISIVLLARHRVKRFSAAMWFDGLMGALTVGALAAAVVFGAVLNHVGGTPLVVATNLAYPLSDLLLLSMVVAVVGLTGWRTRRTWSMAALGLAIFAVADSVYLYLGTTGRWVPGTILEAGWPAAMLLLGYAAWQEPSRNPPVAPEGWRVLLVPGAFALTSLGILVASTFNEVTALAVILSSMSLVVAIARMCVTFGENSKMLRTSRNEAMTDALTGLGNRRKLMLDLEDALVHAPENPSLMLLFDLDGFKSYNDTFGHPAGDALLTRLGQNLTRALTGRGTLYRMGGDEFCALAHIGDEGIEPLISAALAALTEEGEGFSITASFGHIIIPEEADEASEALRVADQRMYVHKNGGRTSVGKLSSDLLMRVLSERSPELAAHLSDVARLAESVAQKLNLDSEEVEMIRMAAELHDVGKVGIPDRILNKPGPLDDFEWDFMRRHTIIGERILLAVPALTKVAHVVRSSHERWDGKGYPDQLRGEDIPLGSRIAAVCDAFDAMTQDRPYRSAMSRDAALEELRRCAGSQFDPIVVTAFCQTVIERDADNFDEVEEAQTWARPDLRAVTG